MRMPLWTLIVPAVALPLAGFALAVPPGPALALLCALLLCAAVLASVHHAEVVAHRVGEPFGTLILAVSVTVIEVALIVSMMLAGGSDKSGLARDTIFSAIMIVCNGAVGLCVIAGGLKHHVQSFRLEGATSALAALIVMATLSLVLPVFTTSVPGPDFYSTSQLAFAAVASLALWAVFVFVQTVRHRDYFLPPGNGGDEAVHAPPPSAGLAWASFGLLVVSLLAVIGLAKTLSPTIERVVASAGLPPTVIGIVIAMLVLAPETWAAVRAARSDRLQTSLNLALGSALASIGLTIPAVAILSIAMDRPLRLGLTPKDLVLLALTFAVGAITLGTGRTNVLQGAVHLLIFAAFVFLAIVP
ncbi:MAG TPA: ionic transporter y4hA [Caldimonas sp.]